MDRPHYPKLEAFFRGIVAGRWGIVAVYAVLLPLSVYFALQVGADSSIERLLVETDADYRATRAFHEIFPEGERAILLAEATDVFDAGVLATVADIERRLDTVPRVAAFSALTIFQRMRPGSLAAGGEEERFREFATGTDLFRKQGLVGDDFLGIPFELDVHSPAERNEALAAIDQALAPIEAELGPLVALRRVGSPYVDAYLEASTGRASRRYFPLFGVFVVGLTLALYHSWRTLVAFLATLATAVALTVATAWPAGFVFSIVSSLVPLTILVTATATLVYLQSRFVDKPDGVPVGEHQVFALANKFLPTTASIFAAAVGFAALGVSRIRPIRELGLWVALGLLITWIVVFTLFPALQKILATPTQRHRTVAGRRLMLAIDALPAFSYRWRWPILSTSILLCVAGAAALTGLPGILQPMALQEDPLDYIDPSEPLHGDTRRFESSVSGLAVVQAWVRTPEGGAVDPEVLRGLEDFARQLEADPGIASVVGPTTMLRWKRYVAGQGDSLPEDRAAWPKLASDLEQLLLEEPALRSYVDVNSLAHARLTVVGRSALGGHEEVKQLVGKIWSQAVARHVALADCTMSVVGRGLLQARISDYLVPTLTESFALTAGIIFVAFLLVFRSAAARLLAMIPSLFAILVMFLVMRLCGIPLNVATILIASTVLGASENDQIHFFYHFQEMRGGGTLETRLRHALHVAGRAIVFATLINAGGFLALALSDLPAMRQFGVVASSAFVLSMVASFTALPAALWIFSGAKPDALK